MPLNEPISLDAFSARLDALDVGGKFAVAVSGGRDSMALARLSAEYARARAAKAVALIVDHGLRPESAPEAVKTKNWCEAAGLEAAILPWKGAKPVSGVQAVARKARYRLLAEAAETRALPAILTAHHADDQAETFIMRLARGAGVEGLAAMDEQTWIAAGAGAPVRLLRPLLNFTREALTMTVNAYGQPYIGDPSNDNLDYERVRARAFLHDAAAEGVFKPAGLIRSAERLKEARCAAREQSVREFNTGGGVFTRWGGASIDRGAAAKCSGETMARLIRAVSGAEYAPDPKDAAAHLAQALASGAAAIGGALLKASGARLWVMREPAAILGRAGVAAIPALELGPGERALWDNRFIITAREAVTIRPLGAVDAAALGPAAGLFEGPGEGLTASPGIYQGERLIAAADLLSGIRAAGSVKPLAEERFSARIIRFLQD